MGKKKEGKWVFPEGEQLEQIQKALKELGLYGIASSYQFFAEKNRQAHGTDYDYLIKLLQHEFAQKEEGRKSRSLIQSKLPKDTKSLEEFVPSWHPSIDPVLIKELGACRFIDEGQNVIFLGPPGVGKTFLANALGLKAIDSGREVRFTRLNEFIDAVHKADDLSLIRLHRSYIAPKLLILDDIDYFTSDPEAGEFLFKVLKERCESRLSTIITSNKNPKIWDIFGKPENTPAILDRLFEDGRTITINIVGSSRRVTKIPELATDGTALDADQQLVPSSENATKPGLLFPKRLISKHRKSLVGSKS